MMKIKSIWLRWTIRIFVAVGSVLLVAAIGGSGYLWYSAHQGLRPSGYKPAQLLLSFSDELGSAPQSKESVDSFSWGAISAPPRTSMPWVRWWWPGADVEESQLALDLQQLHDANFGGAEIQPLTFGVDEVVGKDNALHARV